ncbi:hypothetical protein N9R86_01760 [Alphaproteobacteria bacterium]|nr:hypothetical protein [Alphaproteobacteria bacterium]
MKIILTISTLLLLFVKLSLADSKIIKDGLILQSKPYSLNETTLVVSNSNKIYVCSIIGELTKCILSTNNKNFIN